MPSTLFGPGTENLPTISCNAERLTGKFDSFKFERFKFNHFEDGGNVLPQKGHRNVQGIAAFLASLFEGVGFLKKMTQQSMMLP